MKKKGDAELIAVVLLIMIVILVITSVSYFYLTYIEEADERIEFKNKVNNADITITDVRYSDSLNLTVTFFSGPSFQELVNQSTEEVTYAFINVTRNVTKNITKIINGSFVNVSIVSVADISGSMNPNLNPLGLDKIGELRNATNPFIESVLNNSENRIGLVAYDSIVRDEHCHPLSDDIVSLNDTVNGWTTYLSTCTCCGIDRAIEYLETAGEDHYKAMIVMSDGRANINCPVVSPELSGPVLGNIWCSANPNDACDDAIYLAQRAFEDYGIIVHTIGFGSDEEDLDVEVLEAMAEAGNGTYYFANVSELEYIYESLWENVSEEVEANVIGYEYEEVTVYENVTTVVYALKDTFYLKIVFYAGDLTYIQNKALSDFPGPVETKQVDLSLDTAWGITTDDLTKIEIYSAIKTEEGDEVISDLPVAVWEKAGLYHII